MSLSLLLTAVNEYVSDTLVNDCGRPAPTRQLTYHGRIPADCCTDDGYLVTSWENGRVAGNEPCGMPLYTISIRYTVCWSIPEGSESGIEISDEQDATWNNDALMLADVGDCVARALLDLTCTTFEDPYAEAVMNLGVRATMRYVGATAIVPLGGCAGVQWQLNAAPRNGPVIS